jgi:parallel beta-helix repeat protein
MKKRLMAFACSVFLIGLLVAFLPFHLEGARALDVEGSISSDTTWTLLNSPYTVRNDVTIASGVTLAIQHGVEVKFEKGSSLIVFGSLYAVGDALRRVSFTSNEDDPIAGDWNGIKFYGNGNSTLTISYCDLDLATVGITIESQAKAVIEESRISSSSTSGIHAIGVTNLLIEDNTIRQNANGISTSGISSSGLRIISNTISSNENGIYLNVYGENSRIHNVTISDNVLKDNINGIYLSSSGPSVLANAYLNNVTISRNLIDSNKHGMYLVAQGWGQPGLIGGGAHIYDVSISNNTVYFSESAICVNSTSNWYSWISSLVISGNTIHSSEEGLVLHAFRTPQPPLHDEPFDVTVFGNIVSANGRGISVAGDLRVNLTGNSLSHNTYGIYLISSVTSKNVAHNNDIYENTAYGIYVGGSVTIEAQINYWGASSGPYHETMHPSGVGDRVNGNGENLVFEPFSMEPFGAINEAPSAMLTVNVSRVTIDQPIFFDGSGSEDDSSILDYLFDFGDGTNMHQSLGLAKHEYVALGIYNASLVVMDDLGVSSANVAVVAVTVFVPSLEVSVFLNPLSVVPQGRVSVEVHVSDGEAVVPDALVQLSSDNGGYFELPSGYTNSDGDFESDFFAPSVSEPLRIRVSATASKESYQGDSDEADLSVLPVSSGGIGFGPWWIWFAAVVASVMVVVVGAFMRKRRKAKRALSLFFAYVAELVRPATCSSTCFQNNRSRMFCDS